MACVINARVARRPAVGAPRPVLARLIEIRVVRNERVVLRQRPAVRGLAARHTKYAGAGDGYVTMWRGSRLRGDHDE